VDAVRWFVLFRERRPGALELRIVPGKVSEQKDVAIVAFEQGWHGMWVFDREPNQEELVQGVVQGKGIGEHPGATQLYVNQESLEEKP
jgi:hypothetical protein